ncbi:MAG: DNA alkylation repair protein [Dehalogenimonas sp.]
MKTNIISVIRQELELQVDDKTKESYQSFFKEPVTAYGVKTAIVNKIAKGRFGGVKHLGKPAIFALCEKLLESDYNEEAFIALQWAYWLHDEYEPSDFAILERWIEKYINNWAKCDTLCNHAVGAFIERYPHYMDYLKKWTVSENRWLRRASAVTLIIPAKKGKFLSDIFQIADSLLQDKDDLVQKGYGWMLKEASIEHQEEVFDYILRNKTLMPRTALRYALERMPKDLKQKAMAKP